MSSVSTHSLRPHVYVVEQHHTVDDAMLDRMMERRIIPAFDMFPEQPFIDIDTDLLMSRPEIMSLSLDAVDQIEKCLDTLTELVGVDWVALPRLSKKSVLFAHVRSYQYIRYQAHLHIKHFIKFSENFSMNYEDIPENILNDILKTTTLSELPSEVYTFIQHNKPAPPPMPAVEPLEQASDDDDDTEEPENVTANDITAIPQLDNPYERIRYTGKSLAKQTRQTATTDDQLVTPVSLSSISRTTDTTINYLRLHVSIMALHDYLRTNMNDIHEYHSPDCDIAFQGEWHDGVRVDIQAFSLSDTRGHNAWYINITQKSL